MPKRFEEIGSEPDRLFYSASHLAVRAVGFMTVLFRVEGAEHIPQEGRGIIVCNHLDGTDVLFVPSAVPDRHVTVAGRRGQMEKPVIGTIFRRWGAVTIDRANENPDFRAMKGSLKTMEGPLEEDRLELIFASPDTRTPGKKPTRAKRGVARAAQDTRSPVIPAVIKGSDQLSEQRVTVKFGHPLNPPRRRGEHDEFLDRLLVAQTWLFDSIPDGGYYHDSDDYS